MLNYIKLYYIILYYIKLFLYQHIYYLKSILNVIIIH